jgi:hypothetical protein
MLILETIPLYPFFPRGIFGRVVMDVVFLGVGIFGRE